MGDGGDENIHGEAQVLVRVILTCISTLEG